MKAGRFVMVISLFMYSTALSSMTITVDFGDAALNTALQTQIETQVLDKIGKFDYVPKLARGFGNANAYVSQAATMRGYQGYQYFAVALGTMVAVQPQSEDPMFFTKLQDEIQNTGNVYTGIGVTPWAVQGGINLGFILPGLYVSGKFGKLNYTPGKSFGYSKYKYKTPELAGIDIAYNTNLYGVSVNYQILKERSILAGILMWRGVSVEPGFNYSLSRITYRQKMDTEQVSASSGGYTLVADVDPSIDLMLETTSAVIPFEVYSSMRILYMFNFGAGAGLDYIYGGKTDLKIAGAGGATITDDGVSNASGYVGRTATVAIDASTKDVKADKYRYRCMINLGFSTGPVFIDLPFTYYFTDSGYVVGFTVGSSW